jgi:cysteine protease IpaJ
MAKWGQQYRESCGAACLLCAAVELNVTTIPINNNYTLWRNVPMPLTPSAACEKRLYQVTSAHPHWGDPNGWGINLPSNIIVCARMLGLKAKAIAYNTYTVSQLKKLFIAEMPRLASLHALEKHGSSHSTYKPNPRQRELRILVDRDSGAMHYVMVRPDDTVMDPGNGGANLNSIQDVKTHTKMHGTGLSVFIQQP